MKWYNIHTKFRSFKDELRLFLKKNNIKYELSGDISDWHFEILLDDDSKQIVENFIDSIVISEK